MSEKLSFSKFLKVKESALDGTQGYDQPLSPAANQVIQMCQHYFQTLSDNEIQYIGQMIQQVIQNKNQRTGTKQV